MQKLSTNIIEEINFFVTVILAENLSLFLKSKEIFLCVN